MTRTAKLIRALDWNSNASLYKLSEPVEFSNLGTGDRSTTGYVIASAVIAFGHWREECLVFPAKEDGELWNMLEIIGRRTMSHAEVLGELGFEIVD